MRNCYDLVSIAVLPTTTVKLLIVMRGRGFSSLVAICISADPLNLPKSSVQQLVVKMV